MFLVQSDAEEKFDEYYSVVAQHPEAQFGYIKYIYENDDVLKLATNQLRKSVLRSCLKETYEVLKIECSAEDRMVALKRAPWYQFLRMVRNSLSHDFNLNFRRHDKTLLPVSWSGLTITEEMDGKELPMLAFLTRVKALELIDEVIEYSEQHLG